MYRFWSICFLALTRHSVRFLAVRVSCVFIVIADAYISGIIQIYNVIAIFNTQRNRYYSVYVVILVRFHFPFITGSFDQKRIVEKPLIEKYQYATFSLCVFFDMVCDQKVKNKLWGFGKSKKIKTWIKASILNFLILKLFKFYIVEAFK